MNTTDFIAANRDFQVSGEELRKALVMLDEDF